MTRSDLFHFLFSQKRIYAMLHIRVCCTFVRNYLNNSFITNSADLYEVYSLLSFEYIYDLHKLFADVRFVFLWSIAANNVLHLLFPVAIEWPVTV